MIFNYIGPLPPYSFVSTTFNEGNYELINKARTVLGLKQESTFDEVKINFRKMASSAHPDKNGGQDNEMSILNEAYQVLKAYCLNGREGKYCFSKEAIEQSFLQY